MNLDDLDVFGRIFCQAVLPLENHETHSGSVDP